MIALEGIELALRRIKTNPFSNNHFHSIILHCDQPGKQTRGR